MLYDYLIVGGGIIGIATAWQLQQRFPGKKILVVEKERQLAAHQTGHNSGVIHAGVYYTPGSLKAQFCKQGAADTLSFCRQYQIACNQCGKLLVATNSLECERMEALYQRCADNRIETRQLNRDELKQREPNITGLGAILVPATAIVDYRQVTRKMADLFCQLGGEVRSGTEVVTLRESSDDIQVATGEETLRCRFLISCPGLMADRIAKMLGIPIDFRIIPIRGEYYRLPAAKNRLVNHLIYPIPDPELPFLGIHLTPMIDDSITVGPNAVQSWKREGYGQLNFNLRDTWDVISYGGYWKWLRGNLGAGLFELKNSLFKSAYLRQVQKYCPSVTLADLQPHPPGVRAQAVTSDGKMVEDFLFAESPRSLHVCNAPSPAATSAIPIARYICDRLS